MGSAISGLSSEQIVSISDNIIFQCINAFGAVNDYNPDRIKQIAQKYIQVIYRFYFYEKLIDSCS